MKFGTCKLCGKEGDLLNGHIAPRFAYKRFITGKGGRYFDSDKDKFETRQRTAYMFCRECENLLTGNLDCLGARFLARFEADPYSPHLYDAQFLRWAVSLSLRALFGEILDHAERISAAHDAMGQWKGLLLGQKPSVGPFAQHVFLRYFEEGSHFQKILDWDFFPEQGLTFFKIGPLVVFGLTRRANWPRREKRTADISMVRLDGGYIQRTDDYVAGVNIPSIMKEVSDEKDIRLLEGIVSSPRRAQDYIDQVPEITRLEVQARIKAHRARQGTAYIGNREIGG
jgi:hypothetical protein